MKGDMQELWIPPASGYKLSFDVRIESYLKSRSSSLRGLKPQIGLLACLGFGD